MNEKVVLNLAKESASIVAAPAAVPVVTPPAAKATSFEIESLAPDCADDSAGFCSMTTRTKTACSHLQRNPSPMSLPLLHLQSLHLQSQRN